MATVRMKKGDLYADVFNSPETIENAKREGFSLCDDVSPDEMVEKAIEKELEADVEKVKSAPAKKGSKK